MHQRLKRATLPPPRAHALGYLISPSGLRTAPDPGSGSSSSAGPTARRSSSAFEPVGRHGVAQGVSPGWTWASLALLHHPHLRTPHPAVAEDEPAADAAVFVDLFGQPGEYSKHGWNHYGPGHFELDPETGVLSSHGGMGLLWYSARQLDDFVLELEYKCAGERTNSGVFLRIPEMPANNEYIYHSFEVQIDDASEGTHHTGAVFDAEAPSEHAGKPAGEWNQMRIAFVGDRIEVWINGKQVVDWQAEPRGKIRDFAARGFIGLQNHDDVAPVYFRNVRLAELP